MLTLVLLGIVFLAVVVPQALSARSERQREFLASIQFHAGAAALRHDAAPEPAPVRKPRSAVERRKTIFVFLLVSMAVSVIPVVLSPSKATLAAQLAVDNCFLAYVGLLVRLRDSRTSSPTAAPGATDLLLATPGVRPALEFP